MAWYVPQTGKKKRNLKKNNEICKDLHTCQALSKGYQRKNLVPQILVGYRGMGTTSTGML